MPAPSINLVAFENGVGNSRDIVLLSDALQGLGCAVTVTIATPYARRRRKLGLVRAVSTCRQWLRRMHYARGRLPRFDFTVMLEHVWPEQLHLARHNIIVPNPEFFDRHDRSLLRAFDSVWAKTQNTFDIFAGLGAKPCMIGFDSEDRYVATVVREPTFLHLAGKSRMKGTARLTALWAHHPEWPVLTVVQSLPRKLQAAAAKNIEYRAQFLSDAELKQLQNQNLFHVCTSETEGWGHYIAEAQSVGAIVLATDAPPMHELVTPEHGILIRSSAVGRQHLATTYEFEHQDFERAVQAALDLDSGRRGQLCAAARQWYDDNKRDFSRRLSVALEIA
jgi:glycosyltransferase involved in cell wall biosynthesis